MFERSCQGDCPGIFSKVKAVYLMGCNTLATKKKDHRSIETYLRVLVNDGFPLENAEMVATSRYAQFGEAIETQMQMIFPQSQFFFGFDSTGPLGKKAGPLLKKALLNSSEKDLLQTGASAAALTTSFKGLNARIALPQKTSQENRKNRCEALSTQPSLTALKSIFSKSHIRKNFDVALKMTERKDLRQLANSTPQLKQEFSLVAQDILIESNNLIGIQKKTFDLLADLELIDSATYQKNLRTLFQKSLNFIYLDYVRAEQLCSLIDSSSKTLGSAYSWNLPHPDFESYVGVLSYCFAKSVQGTANHLEQPSAQTAVGQCLTKNEHPWQDWDCLTTHRQDLDLGSCLYAANRNPDLENADNMRWFCWDHLQQTQKVSPAGCLVLSKSMNILGNQIKSNWNCMNRL